jgi:nondiscriminating aspartyl-tRNA synthetase
MNRTYIDELGEKRGEEVTIQAWVDTIRKHGGVQFVLLRDVSGIVQAVVTKSQLELFNQVKGLKPESVVTAEGIVQEETQAPGGFELALTVLQVLSEPQVPPAIPIRGEEADEVSMANRLDYRWLTLRNPETAKIFKAWTELEKGMRGFFEGNRFIQIYPPALMNAASESGAEVFSVDYFDSKAYLAQSPQFFKQMAIAGGLERVYMVGPVFRAEPSFTSRHMTEFTGWDFEMAFIESHENVMATEEAALCSGFVQLKESLFPDLEVPTLPFPRITMAEAKKLLQQAGIQSSRTDDLSPEEERAICEIVREQTGSDFVFITEYPRSVRPFYHMRISEDSPNTRSFDLLYKGVEISTGAQREHRIDVLEQQAIEKGMSLKDLEDYLNFFRNGCPPHGGVGIGPGRIIMKLLDLSSVKEATFLPRDVKRLRP